MTSLLTPRFILRRGALIVLGLLIVLLAVGLPDRASAQSQVLVSNMDRRPSDQPGSFWEYDHAQEFTTGSHALGYTLTSVGLFLGVSESADARSRFNVAIHASSGGAPGSRLATLTAPQPIRNGFNRFTHDGLDLNPSTSYFVVIDVTDRGLDTITNTAYDSESGAPGWRLGNVSLYRDWRQSAGDWTTFSETRSLSIYGVLKRPQLSFPSTCDAAPITPGIYGGTLTGDCSSAFRSGNARHVSFSLAERQSVTLTVESSDFDTYLYLGRGETPDSVDLIDKNDDRGYNELGIDYSNDSQLDVVLDAGDYVAEVTSFEAGSTGSFTLTLETSEAPPPTSEPAPLPAPTGLVASSSLFGDNRLNLSARWNPVEGADFYWVRVTDGRSTQHVKVTGTSIIINDDPDAAYFNPVRPGTTYTVEVTVNAGGPGGNDGLAKATAQVNTLRAPGGLTVSPAAGRHDALDVSWEAVPGASIQFVDWRTPPGSGSFRSRLSFDSSATTHRITGLEPSTEYEVRVTYQSSEQGFACTTCPAAKARGTTAAPPPVTVEGIAVAVHPTDTTILRVTWRPVSGATGYRFEHKEGTDPSDPFTASTAENTTNSFTGIVGLQAGTVYTVRVTALKGADELGSGEAVGSTRAVFGGVEAKSVVNHGDGLIVTWPEFDGDYVYYVYYKRTGSSDAETRVTQRGVSPQRITGLVPDTSYTVRVQAVWVRERRPDGIRLLVVAAGEDTATGTTATLTVKGVSAQTNLIYQDTLKVTWEDDTRADHFRVEYKEGIDFGLTPFTVDETISRSSLQTDTATGKRAHSLDGLDPGTKYTVRVVAIKGTQTGQELGSGQAEGTTRDPFGPITVQPIQGESDKLDVWWTAIPRDDIFYIVEYRETLAGGAYTAVARTDRKATSERITGLTQGTLYDVQVRARYQWGSGDTQHLATGEAIGRATPGSATGNEIPKPLPTTLTDLTVDPVTGEHTQLAVSWTAVRGASKYWISWKEGYSGRWSDNVIITETNYTVTGLSPGTSYTVKVAATDENNVWKAEDDATGTTSGAASAPPSPSASTQIQAAIGTASLTGLTVASVSGQPDRLAVSWGSVQGAATYQVRWKTGSDDYGAAVETTGTTYDVTGLSPFTTYTVNVAALDGNNTLLSEGTASGTTEPSTGQSTDPGQTARAAAGPGDPDEVQTDTTSAVSFVIYYDPDAGDAAADRYNQAVALLNNAGISYSEVRGDVQDEVDKLAGVTGSVIPRFFLGDPTASDWVSQTKVNNGGLRWLKQKVADLNDD